MMSMYVKVIPNILLQMQDTERRVNEKVALLHALTYSTIPNTTRPVNEGQSYNRKLKNKICL